MTASTIPKVITLGVKNIHIAYDGWFYTILGAGGKLSDWYNGYQELCTKEGIGKIKQWYKTKGKVLNTAYDLQGKERFPDDLNILMFDYRGMNVGKLAMFKLRMGDRWFNDVIDNSVRRSGRYVDESEL